MNIYTIVNSFTQIAGWLISTIASILASISTHIQQVYQVVGLLPPFVKETALSFMAVWFMFMLMRWVL